MRPRTSKFLSFFKTQKGQNLIEYSTLLLLVMAGIILMGPYVIRSWNANVKGWEDSVIDSINDPLVEAPPVDIPGCTCTDWLSEGCGPLGGCPDIHMYQTRTCAPLGCEAFLVPPIQTERCIPEESCCTPWVDLECGVLATQITGQRSDGLPGCQDGYRLQERFCTSALVQDLQCVRDLACDFLCDIPAPPDPAVAVLCTGDDQGLSQPRFPVTFVDACSAPNDLTKKCEYLCQPPYIPILNGTTCGLVGEGIDSAIYHACCIRPGGAGLRCGGLSTPYWGPIYNPFRDLWSGELIIDTCTNATYSCIVTNIGHVRCQPIDNLPPVGAPPEATFSSDAGDARAVECEGALCILKADGTVSCQATCSSVGVIGIGGCAEPNKDYPYPGSGLPPDAIDIATGSANCVVRSNNYAFCWGGGISDCNTGPWFNCVIPPVYQGRIVDIASGTMPFTCVLLDDGNVECWGWGDFSMICPFGICGSDDLHQGYQGGDAIKVVASDVACVLTSNNTCNCWGTDPNWRTAFQWSNCVDVSAGKYNICVLTTDGSVSCYNYSSWGGGALPAPQISYQCI